MISCSGTRRIFFKCLTAGCRNHPCLKSMWKRTALSFTQASRRHMSSMSRKAGKVHTNTVVSRGPRLVTELNNTQCKSYIVADLDKGRAVIIDPVMSKFDRYLAVLGYLRCSLDFALETHTHADHITASKELASLTGAGVGMHTKAPAPYVSTHFLDGDIVRVGNIDLRVLHTPGHTPDSVSYYTEGTVFSGDTLLIGGTGRTDFAGGNAGESFDSITNKLFTLPDDTVLLPGHDYRGNTRSTIGHERAHNPRLAGKTRQQYIDIMNNLGLPLPEKIMEALQTNADAVDDKVENIPQYSQLTEVNALTVQQLQDMLAGRIADGHELVVLDVREPNEVAGGMTPADIAAGGLPSIPGAINIPVKALPKEWPKLEAMKSKHIVTVCRAGVRSATAAALLRGLGFERVSNLQGGLLEFSSPLIAGIARMEEVPCTGVSDVRKMVKEGKEVSKQISDPVSSGVHEAGGQVP